MLKVGVGSISAAYLKETAGWIAEYFSTVLLKLWSAEVWAAEVWLLGRGLTPEISILYHYMVQVNMV